MTYKCPTCTKYDVRALPRIPFQAGATYTIDAWLYNDPGTSKSKFLVQITPEGGPRGKEAEYDLNWSFQGGMNHFTHMGSYNDEWIKTGGMANSDIEDYTSQVALLHSSGTTLVRSYNLVPSITTFERVELLELLEAPEGVTTFDILSPNPSTFVSYQNLVDCPVWSD